MSSRSAMTITCFCDLCGMEKLARELTAVSGVDVCNECLKRPILELLVVAYTLPHGTSAGSEYQPPVLPVPPSMCTMSATCPNRPVSGETPEIPPIPEDPAGIRGDFQRTPASHL